jgi:hypothetical protein
MAVLDTGPYFHGTRADLQVGDLLTAGFRSNYDGRVVMNHIYFTAWPKGAGLAAEMAKGDGRGRVYIVEPTGAFEDDPNVTDKKFPGNLGRHQPFTVDAGSSRSDLRLKFHVRRLWRERGCWRSATDRPLSSQCSRATCRCAFKACRGSAPAEADQSAAKQ